MDLGSAKLLPELEVRVHDGAFLLTIRSDDIISPDQVGMVGIAGSLSAFRQTTDPLYRKGLSALTF